MGLWGKKSSSSYDTPQRVEVVVRHEHAGMSHPLYTGPKAGTVEKGNPNPKNYHIKRTRRFGKASGLGEYLVIEINYPDCTNFEGNKILVYEDTKLSELSRQGSIDPHFTNNTRFKAPIARFVPTYRGWKMATRFAILMGNLS
jgi:hypothetical protein